MSVKAFDVARWLEGLGLSQYAPAFRDNDIEPDVLPDLTGEDLIALGIGSIGHRRKLLAAIAQLRDGATAAMPERPAPAPAAEARNSAERRQLSVMFCDLVGSTPLSARLDPEDLRVVLGAYHAAVTEAVQQVEGYVAKYMGDGVLAYFGYPQAHEDDAERALRAGLAVVERVGRLQAGGEKLAARVGIATGLVVVGDLIGTGDSQERGVVGETPNLAARLQAMAEPGTVLLDEPTRRLVGDLFEWRALGPQAVRGFAQPVPVWQALREGSVESRFEALRAASLTPLAGRGEEIELLARRWQRARQGEGQVVLLSGEPGIGKSRLADALQAQLAHEPHVRLRYFCSPHHRDSPLQPFVAQLERAAGFAREDSESVRLDKLDALVVGRDAPPLADLLGLAVEARYAALPQDPQRKRELVLEALLHQLRRLARQTPVLMLFEDAHWADSTSLELLDRAVHKIAQLPVLALISFRPEFRPPWLGQAHVLSLSLSRLGQRETAAMVAGVTAGKSLPPELLSHIIARTDGIPLFVEEMTKSLIEGGQLRETEQGFVLDGPLPTLAVPSSLQASLLARLDRLAPVKEVAQIGAAIGREFAYELVSGVARRPDGELQGALDKLVEAGLVFCRGTPPNALYLFKHALVQDTIYGTLLRDRRQELHARIGQALERAFPETAKTQPEVLAHHFTQAGLAERAIDYWQQAGAHALQRSANIEAISHFNQAIALVPALPEGLARDERELDLQLALGPAVMASRGYGAPEVETVYARARELARHLDAGPRLFAVLRGLWEYYEIRARREGLEIAREVLRIAEQSGDRILRLVANDVMGDTLLWVGDFEAAVRHTRHAMELYDPVQDRRLALEHGGYDPRMACLTFGALALWYLGHADQALAQFEEAIAFAGTLDHPPTSVLIAHVAVVHYLRREPGPALARAEAALEIARAHDLKFWLGHAGTTRGWALAMQGDPAAIEEIRRGIAAYRATGAELELTWFWAMLADALLHHGRADEARAVLEEAIAHAEQTGVRLHLAELHRLHGLALTPAAEREAAFRRALTAAREIGARSLEQRVLALLATSS